MPPIYFPLLQILSLVVSGCCNEYLSCLLTLFPTSRYWLLAIDVYILFSQYFLFVQFLSITLSFLSASSVSYKKILVGCNRYIINFWIIIQLRMIFCIFCCYQKQVFFVCSICFLQTDTSCSDHCISASEYIAHFCYFISLFPGW